MAELREALATAAGDAEVVIGVDAEGEWADVPPYFDKRAVVCGYFTTEQACVAEGMMILVTGAETAL